jgi:hypothetical protein
VFGQNNVTEHNVLRHHPPVTRSLFFFFLFF